MSKDNALKKKLEKRQPQPTPPQSEPVAPPENDKSLHRYVGKDLVQHDPHRAFALKALRHHAERCGLEDHVYEVLNLRQLVEFKLRPTVSIEFFVFNNIITDDMLKEGFAFICSVFMELRSEFDRHTHNNFEETAKLTKTFFHALQRAVVVDCSKLLQVLNSINNPAGYSIEKIHECINDARMCEAWVVLEGALQEIFPGKRKFCEVEWLLELPPSGARDSLTVQRRLQQQDDAETTSDSDRLRRLACFLLSRRQRPEWQQDLVTRLQPLLSQDMVDDSARQFVQIIVGHMRDTGTLVDRASPEAGQPWTKLAKAYDDMASSPDGTRSSRRAERKLNRLLIFHKEAIMQAKRLLSKIVTTSSKLQHEGGGEEFARWDRMLNDKKSKHPLLEDDSLPENSEQLPSDDAEEEQGCDASMLVKFESKAIKVRGWSTRVDVRLLYISSEQRLHLAQAEELNSPCTLTAAPLDKDIEPWLTADELIRHPRLSRILADVGGGKLAFQVSSQQLKQPAQQSAGIVLHGPPYHAPRLCQTDDALVLGAIVKAPGGHTGEVERAIGRLNELNDHNLGAFMLSPTVTLAASALLTTCASAYKAEQSPLTVDFCPPCLRLAASEETRATAAYAMTTQQMPDSVDPILLLQTYWRDRFKLPTLPAFQSTAVSPEEAGGASDCSTTGQVAQVLSLALSDERLRTGCSIGLVPTRQFAQVAKYCQQGGLSFEIWRPVIYAFRVSRLNLTTVRTRMFRLQAAQALTLVFLTFTERIPIADISRLLLPFTNRLSMVRILLDQNNSIVRDLSASPVAAHLYSLHGDADAIIERPRHRSFNSTAEPIPAAMLQLSQDNGSRGFNLDSLAWEDAHTAKGWNLRLDNSITDALRTLSYTGTSPDGRGLDTSTSDETRHRAPASNFHLHLIAHSDAGVLTFLRTTHLKDTAKPFDSTSPSFYQDLDAALDPRKDSNGVKGGCIVVTSADLLSVAEKRALRDRLEATQRSAVFFSTLLDPVDPEVFQSRARTTSVHDLTRCVPSALLLLPWLEQHWMAQPEQQQQQQQQQSRGTSNRAEASDVHGLQEDIGSNDLEGDSPAQQHWRASCRSNPSHAQAFCVLLQLLLGTAFSAEHLETQGPLTASAMLNNLKKTGPPAASCSSQDWSRSLDLLSKMLTTAEEQGRAETDVGWLDNLYNAIRFKLKSSEIQDLLAWPSYEQFLSTSTVVQLLPRRERLTQWLATTLAFLQTLGGSRSEHAVPTWQQLNASIAPMTGSSCVVLPRRPSDVRQHAPDATTDTSSHVYDYFARDLQSSDHTEELLLRSAQRLEELDWQYLTTVWGELAISLNSLIRLLRCCSRPLHLILTIGPQILDAFLQGASEQQLAQLRDIFGLVSQADQAHTHASKSLPAIIQHLCKSRDTKFASLAVLVFHLVSGHGNVSAPACVTDDHIHLMLTAKLHFKVTGTQDAETLLRSLCAVDSPSTLFVAQQGLVRAITELVDVESLSTILSIASRIGAALVAGVLHLLDVEAMATSSSNAHSAHSSDGSELRREMMLDEQRQDQMSQQRRNILETPLGHSLAAVFRDAVLPGDSRLAEYRQQMGRLSYAGWALLLRRLNSNNTDALVNTMYEVPGGNQLMVLRECLCKAEKPLSLENALVILLGLKQRDPNILWQQVRTTESDPRRAELFDLLCAAIKNPADFSWDEWVQLGCPQLPVHFAGMRPVLQSLASWLILRVASGHQLQQRYTACVDLADNYLRAFHGQALDSLLVHAEECIQDTPLQPDLYIVLWVLRPVRRFALDLDRLEGAAWKLVCQLAGYLDLKRRLQEVMVPPLLATYLTTPERLPLAVFLSFERSVAQFSHQTVSPDTFIVGQSKSQSHTSRGPSLERPLSVNLYGQKVDGRHMFQRLRKQLEADSLPKPESISSLVFVVDSGCNEDIMLLNLRAFTHLCSKTQRVGMQDATRESSDTRVAANRQYVSNLILLWFQALGVSPKEVKACARSVLGDSDFGFEPPEAGSATAYMAEPSLIAPPGVVDVHMRGNDSLLEPFGDKQEDQEFTLRYIRLFAPSASTRAEQDEGESVGQLAGRAATDFGRAFASDPDRQREGVRVFMLALQTFFRTGDQASARAKPRTSARKMLRQCIRGIVEKLPSPTSDVPAPTSDVPAPTSDVPARFFRYAVRSVGFSEDATQCDRDDPTKEDTTNRQLVLQLMEEYVKHRLCVCTATFYEINFCVDNDIYRPVSQQWEQFKQLVRRDVDAAGSVSSRTPHLCYISEPDGPVSASTHLRTLASRLGVTQNGELATSYEAPSAPEKSNTDRTKQAAFFQVASGSELTSSPDEKNVFTHSSAGIESLEGPVSLSFPQTEPVVVRLQDVICLQDCFGSGSESENELSFGAYAMCVHHGQGGVLCMQRIPDEEEAIRQRQLATLVFFSRDALVEGRIQDIQKHYHILQTFPTHDAVWQQVARCAPPGSLIIGNGIMLARNTTTRHFEPVFLQPEHQLSLDERLLLMHSLQNYGLVPEVATVLRGLTVLAFAQTSPQPGEFWRGLSAVLSDDLENSCVDALFENIAQRALGVGNDGVPSSTLHPNGDSTHSLGDKFWKWHELFCATLQESAPDVAGFEQALEELKEDVPEEYENMVDTLKAGLLYARMEVQKSEIYRTTVMTQATVEGCLDVAAFLKDCGGNFDGPWERPQYPSIPGSVQWAGNAPAMRISSQGTDKPCRFVVLEKGSTHGQFTRQAYILSWRPAPSNHCKMIAQYDGTYRADEQAQVLSQDLVVWLTRIMSARLTPQLHRWFVRMVLTRNLCQPPEVDPSTNISCYLTCFSLADTCCDPDHRASLLSAFPLPDPLPKYFGHVSEVYGVYVVHARVLHILRERHRIPLRVVDTVELQARGIVTKDHIYSTIIQQFVDGVVLVYVRGFSTIEDLLLKWCAEYTKAMPYHYIMFEQLDTSRNFSENRDRCNLQLYRTLTLEELQVLGSMATGDQGSAADMEQAAAPQQSRAPHAFKPDASLTAGTPGTPGNSQQQAPAQPRTSLKLSKRRKQQRLARRTAACTATMSIDKVEYKASRQLWDVASLDAVTMMPPNQQVTAVSGDWKHEIREWLHPSADNEEAQALSASSAALRAFVIFSPPGAGKTRFMEKTIMPLAQSEGFERQYFDCSNSRLIEENLTSLLENVCANRAGKTFLVVDEFHMLTWAQKEEIFNYLLSRDQTLYTVLIGNRKEKEDDDLLEKWKNRKADVRSMICRLPIKHLGTLLQQECAAGVGDKPLHALCWWYGACRALFSDDVLTYRNRTPAWKAMADGGSSHDLGNILSKKAPFLGPLTCERISHFTMQLFNQVWERLSADPNQMLETLLSEEDGDPFSLLVRAGLASYLLTLLRDHKRKAHDSFTPDQVSEGEAKDLEPDSHVLLSFPEYCRQLKESHCIPPAVRLALWCRFVFSNCVTELQQRRPTQSRREPASSIGIPSVGALQMLCMIDQPTFPLITELAADPQPLGEGRAFSETGDYTNLEWIRVSLQKNAAISWARARRVWRQHFVSDIEGVTRLLNEAPDPYSVLTALDPANLCALMRAKRHAKSGHDLCGAVIRVALRQLTSTGGGAEAAPPGGNANSAANPAADDTATTEVLDTSDSQSPVCLAAWLAFDWYDQLIRGLVSDIAPILMGDTRNSYRQRRLEKQAEQLRSGALIWASTYSSTEPAAQGSAEEATEKLKRRLIDASEAILVANRPSAARELDQLWSRRFACLMPRQEKDLVHLRAAVFLLAGNHFPCHEDWPPLFMRIGKVMNETATSDDVLKLSQSPFFVSSGSDYFELCKLSPGTPGYVEEERFVKGLLSPRLPFHLPTTIQHALLVGAKAAKCMPAEMPGVEYIHRKFAHALIRLENSKFIQAGTLNSELQNRYRLVHGAASMTERKQVLERAQGRQNRKAAERLKKDMQHMRKYLSVDDPDILRYYNRCLGVHSLEAFSNSNVDVDEYKNPRGAQFDLAVDDAFRGHAVLIGNFFKAHSAFVKCQLGRRSMQHEQVAGELDLKQHEWRVHDRQFCIRQDRAETLLDRSNLISSVGEQVMLPELPESMLRQNIEPFMRRKGFDFDIVASEQEFARQLRTGRYSVAWVISGAAVDAYDAAGSLEHWQRGVLDMAQACHGFHQSGGGILVFGENDPFHVHANAVLQLLGCNLDLRGDIFGSNFVVRRKYYTGEQGDDVLSKASNGQMVDRHPITTGLVTLYEGVTICHPHCNVSNDWEKVVRGGFSKNDSKRPVPVVLARDGEPGGRGRGRVVVDTGFTKLWVNWNVGGTDRYVMNATSWLVGKDLELRPESPVSGLKDPALGFAAVGPWLAAQVQEAAPPAVDLICIVDLSGSMESFFAQLRSFLHDMVDMFQIGGGRPRNRMAVIGFGTNARVDTWLTNDADTLRYCIAQLSCRGGTQFQPPLQEALQRLQHEGQGNRRRVLMFQTDGVNCDRGPEIGRLSKRIVDGCQTTSYAIVVGDMNARDRVRDIAGPAGRYNSEDRRSGANSDYILFINDYDTLQREAKDIATKLNSAS